MKDRETERQKEAKREREGVELRGKRRRKDLFVSRSLVLMFEKDSAGGIGIYFHARRDVRKDVRAGKTGWAAKKKSALNLITIAPIMPPNMNGVEDPGRWSERRSKHTSVCAWAMSLKYRGVRNKKGKAHQGKGRKEKVVAHAHMQRPAKFCSGTIQDAIQKGNKEGRTVLLPALLHAKRNIRL